MHDYTLAHLSDAALLRDLVALVAQDRLTTASLLAHIAEVDHRRLYVAAGYSSMFAYSIDELRLSEDAAAKRIQAARAARRFPVLFVALAEGRLHLTAVCLLAPHLTPEYASELIEAATHRRKSDIETWLARRFGAPEPRTVVRAVRAASPVLEQHVPEHVGLESAVATMDLLLQHAPGHAATEVPGPGHHGIEVPVPGDAVPEPAVSTSEEHAPAHVDAARCAPPPERYLVQVTIDKSTHDKLRYAQALLSHAVPGGSVAKVLDRALDALIARLEKRKFGSSERPRQPRRSRRPLGSGPKSRERHIPAPIRRAVWERDKGQCTFVGANGTRCRARHFLQFDHIEPVARGGRATVAGLRLRCRAHNQHEAERAFGSEFMSRKREEARMAAAKRRAARLAAAEARDAETRNAAREWFPGTG